VESHTVAVQGIPVRWEESGEGVPVVFVHGIPTSPMLWREVVPRVAGARCLAFEMVGYGYSIPCVREAPAAHRPARSTSRARSRAG
jgi:pimeloyl-ACP methyl ester carboxylesterase